MIINNNTNQHFCVAQKKAAAFATLRHSKELGGVSQNIENPLLLAYQQVIFLYMNNLLLPGSCFVTM